MRHALGVMATVVLAGCAPALEVREETVLAGTLELELGADSAWLTLHVTNPTAGGVVVAYPTAQRADFELRKPDGTLLWRWSADRQFAQVMTEEQLEAGESVSHRVSVPLPPAGEYVAVGWLASSNQALALRTPFRVGPE